MQVRRKFAIAGAGILALAGIGAGTAFAQAGRGSTKARVVSTVNPPGPAITPAAADTDTLQQGDQTTPDKAGTTAGETAAASEGAGAETTGAEEPGDANLPGGGHADPPGQNVDHQAQGVE